VVFDLGGVLIDWNPRYLFRKLFGADEDGMERFLTEICTTEWNLAQDAGRSWAEGKALLQARHPAQAELIEAYHRRWDEMVSGSIAGSVAILAELKGARVPVYGLTNFSRETFPLARRRFDFLDWFDGIVVSGEVNLVKPDPRIYQLLFDRFGLTAAESIFIDDNAGNTATAARLGMHAIHFTDPSALRGELAALGLLPEEVR
jgi:2-haloacid dehalogenase